MKKWIITFCLSFMVGIASGAIPADSVDNKSVLIERLNSTTIDTLRLKILYDLTVETKSVPKERVHYIDQLLKEAQECGNSKYICNAYLSYMYLAYNRYDADEVFKWMKLLEPIARKEKLYDQLFSGKQCYVDMLLIKEQYEFQEREAQKMLEEAMELNNTIGIIAAYQCLAYGYQFTYRMDKAIESLEKGYLLIPQCKDDLLNTTLISTLITLLENRKDKPKWLKYIKAQEDYFKKMIEREPKYASILRADMMQVYIYYLEYYMYTKDEFMAAKSSEIAKEYYSVTYAPAYRLVYHNAQYKYNVIIGDHKKALEEIDKALAVTDTKFDVNYYSMMSHKAEIIHMMGNFTESVSLFKIISQAKDSIQKGILNTQTQQIKTSYNADTLLLEKEKIQKQALLSLLIPICVVFVILVFFVMHIYNIGRKLRVAKEEMGKMANIVNQANIAKEKFLSNIGVAIRDPLDLIVNDSLRLSSNEELDKTEKAKLSSGIKDTSSKLLDMINNILMLSKLEAGMMKFKEGEMDVYSFIRNMAEIKSFNNKIPISTTFPIEVEQNVKIDINLFTQLFDSLFATMAEGCSQIVISEYSSDSRQISITIQGSGLAAKEDSQQIVIQNEINRMLIEHFGGEYTVHSNEDVPYVRITLVKAEKDHSDRE